MFREDLFRGKTLLVTGGGSGIGFCIVENIYKLQGNVAVFGRDTAKFEKVYALKNDSLPGGILCCQCDVRDEQLVTDSVAKVVAQFGKIDYLVNAAAGNYLRTFQELSVSFFRTVLEIDTVGTFIVSKQVFMQSMKQHGGSIVSISATMHYSGTFMQTHVAAAKAAIDGMTKTMAVELGPYGVTVNAVAPGGIEDSEGYNRVGDIGEDLKKYYGIVPLQRAGYKYDIAETVIFMLNQAYATGQIIAVDGGQWAMVPQPTLLSKKMLKKWNPKL